MSAFLLQFWSLQPRPVRLFVDEVNSTPANPELFSDGMVGLSAQQRLDLKHGFFGELCIAVALAPVASAMGDFGKFILARGCPLNVDWVAASRKALAATVSRLMLRRRGGAVHSLANQSVHVMQNTIHSDSAVPIAISREGPYQAIFTDMRDDQFAENSLRFSRRNSASRGVTVVTPAHQMRPAPAVPLMGLAAARNRAYSGSSHVSLRNRLVGQSASLAGQPSARSYFVPSPRRNIKRRSAA